MKILLVAFWGKKLIWGNFIFSGHFLMFYWVWSKLSQATVTIGSLKSHDMIEILKQSGQFLWQVFIWCILYLGYYVQFLYGRQYSA